MAVALAPSAIDWSLVTPLVGRVKLQFEVPEVVTTSTLIWQLAPAARLAPERPIEPAPAVAVRVALAQVVEALGVAATVYLLKAVGVRLSPVTAAEVLLVTVRVRVERPPT